MSVVNQKNLKVLLPRTGPDDFWQTISDRFAQADARKWKYLAMLALRENAGWPLEQIAKVFQHQPGHISRCLVRIKEELREHFTDPNLSRDECMEDSGSKHAGVSPSFLLDPHFDCRDEP